MQIYPNRGRSDLNIKWLRSPLRKLNLFIWYHDRDFIARAVASDRNDNVKDSNKKYKPGFLPLNENKLMCIGRLKDKTLAPVPINISIVVKYISLYRLSEYLKFEMKVLRCLRYMSVTSKLRFVKFILKMVIYFMKQSKKPILLWIAIH